MLIDYPRCCKRVCAHAPLMYLRGRGYKVCGTTGVEISSIERTTSNSQHPRHIMDKYIFVDEDPSRYHLIRSSRRTVGPHRCRKVAAQWVVVSKRTPGTPPTRACPTRTTRHAIHPRT
ncbi:hypothetical protein B566_EDAN016107 [Ephemera danica]|nr:hypothetical protein B566_EDAN016107 [Ephemera danica]